MLCVLGISVWDVQGLWQQMEAVDGKWHLCPAGAEGCYLQAAAASLCKAQHKTVEQGRSEFPSSSADGSQTYFWPAVGEELAGSLDIQAALELGPGAIKGLSWRDGGGNLRRWRKGGKSFFSPHSKCCGSCEVPGGRD